MTAVDNIMIEKGSTFKKTYLYKDESKTAISLASYEARMQIRNYASDSDIVVELTSSPADGITLESGGETGRIDIRIGADVTEVLTIDSGVYDLELYDPLDTTEVTRLVEGVVNIKGEITR